MKYVKSFFRAFVHGFKIMAIGYLIASLFQMKWSAFFALYYAIFIGIAGVVGELINKKEEKRWKTN